MKTALRVLIEARLAGAVDRQAKRDVRRKARNEKVAQYRARMKKDPVIEIPENSPLYQKRQNRQEIAA
ncbi:MAG: hypothetical protein IT168_33125 [Bryobacterales bacterium]|nr:hypothetical protein [Bryobacterales bacterium]